MPFGAKARFPAAIIKPITIHDRVLFGLVAGLSITIIAIGAYVVRDKLSSAAAATSQRSDSFVGNLAVFTVDKEVPLYTRLSDAHLHSMYIQRYGAPPGIITDKSKIIGLYAKTDLLPGKPILESHLSPELKVRTIVEREHMRGVTISVDPQNSIYSQAIPGSAVDVILNYTDQRTGVKHAKIIVESALVLAESTESACTGPRCRYNADRTVTLEVTVEDMLELSMAPDLGRLTLGLRKEPGKAHGTAEITGEQLLGKPQPDPVKSIGQLLDGNEVSVVTETGRIYKVERPVEP